VVDVTVIAMWAHPRAVSTAFLRMMIERGDVTVVHEPLVTLADWSEIELPDRHGGKAVLRDAGAVLDHLLELGKDRVVFFKDTLEYQHKILFDRPDHTARLTHTFLVREPKQAINSHYALKPAMSLADVGYEHQWNLFQLAQRLTGRPPVVVRTEELLADPARVVRAWCAAVGLPFLAHALSWQPQDRAEWRLSRRWHVEASVSSGFSPMAKVYDVTVDNHPGLRAFYDHHRPFYDHLVQHSI
jgi:hypothetical protein